MEISASQIPEPFVRLAFPRARILEAERLTDGLRNSSFKLRLDSVPEPLVLRIYQHDPVLCQKELDLLRMLTASVAVPEPIHAEPRASPPFAFFRWVDGITFRELRRAGNHEAIAQASRSIGEALAAVHQHRFLKGGWLSAGPAVTWPLMEGAHSIARFVDRCLESARLQPRLPGQLRDAVHALLWRRTGELDACEAQSQLVHGDFSQRNVVVRESNGRWVAAAVLDWEFAVSGTPLADFGNFLRYERAAHPACEPFLSSGYRAAGGALPDGWQRLIRIVDLAALCELLSRDQLPADVAVEIGELVRATVEDRDPPV